MCTAAGALGALDPVQVKSLAPQIRNSAKTRGGPALKSCEPNQVAEARAPEKPGLG